MKKITIGLILFVIIIIGLGFLIKYKVGDIRPALLPAKKSPQAAAKGTKAKAGEPIAIPLKTPEGLQISVFSSNTPNARDITFSEKGTLLVSEPGEGNVVALPDRDNDGTADEEKNILTDLNRPHGMAFYKGKLFVAEETRMVRYNWNEDTLTATEDKKLFDMPAGARHHTRTLDFDKDGKMYVSIGSSCDVCNEKHEWIAAVITSDADGKNPRLYAKGLRNSPFIKINPQTNQLWGTEMGRDFLGDDLPPDEINIIQDGKDYGWPLCYGNNSYDIDFGKKIYEVSPCDFKGRYEKPIYEIPAHSAPLGLAFINSEQFPAEWQGDLLVSYHGSWNSTTPVGYKVVRMNVEGNTIIGEEDFITGFIEGSEAVGRPVDVEFDNQGNLFISDDKAGAIYVVSKK